MKRWALSSLSWLSSVDRKFAKIRDLLEGLYARYSLCSLIKPDPLQFVYRYRGRPDMELAGFLASALAYGRVRQIEKSLNDLFDRMGESPFEFVMNFDKRRKNRLKGFRHRFTGWQDVCELLSLLKKVLAGYGGIERYFLAGYRDEDDDVAAGLSRFRNSLLQIYAGSNKGFIPQGLRYLLADPAAGSPCKRLNLFLRWMVRDKDVDAGLWRSVDCAKLIVPMDVHMARLCRLLGLYNRRTVSLPAAREITRSFAVIEPSDPVKYDFALSRVGITGGCTGRQGPHCEFCELADYCPNSGD